MATVGIKELEAHTTDILRKVGDAGKPIDITLSGEVIALIIPVARSNEQLAHTTAAWADLKQLAAEIGARHLPPTDVSTLMGEERE